MQILRYYKQQNIFYKTICIYKRSLFSVLCKNIMVLQAYQHLPPDTRTAAASPQVLKFGTNT